MEWIMHVFIVYLLALAVHSQEETRCNCLIEEEQVVTINVIRSLTSPLNTLTVSFQNYSSAEKEKVLECDLMNNTYRCDFAKGYTLDEVSNTFSINIKRRINCTDGRFAITVNEEKTSLCSGGGILHVPDKQRHKRNSNSNWCPLKDPSKDKKTSGSVSKPPEPHTKGPECPHNNAVNNNNRQKRSHENCLLAEDSPENFHDEKGGNGLAIGLGLGIAAVAVAVVVVAAFLNRNRLRKRFHDVIAVNGNHKMSQNKTEELGPLNPGLPEEAGHKEIQKHVDAENEKMVVIDFHEAAGDQSQCVTDRHMSSNTNPRNVVHV